jgi:hypothetical protein
MNPKEKAAWADRRLRLRTHIMGILRKIESGEVDAVEFAQLWNFTSTMLMLLSKVTPGTLDAAKKEADLAAYLNDAVEDWEVFDE